MSESDPGNATAPGPSRRGFVLATGAVLAAAGGGSAAALIRHRPSETTSQPISPTILLAAVAAESRLIAAIDAVHDPAALAHLRADHVAHRSALLGAVQVATGAASPSAQPTSSPPEQPTTSPAGQRLSLTQLLAMESAASSAAAAAAIRLTGADAALLASIAACEASHAELLR